MNTPQWIKYDGSDKQIEEINNARYGILAKNNFNHIWPDTYEHFDFAPIGATEYLICQPHPYADLIDIWRLSGCPVWVRPRKPYEFKISDYLNHPTTRLMVDGKGVYLITTTPDWNIPGAKYSLTPFED